MSAINTIKEFCWKRAVKPCIKPGARQRHSFNLDNAKTVGIIYDASEEYMIKEVETFFNYLKFRKIMHKSLGYAKYTIIPHYCIPQLTKLFICKKDVNWCWKPAKSKTEDFINEEFDLLVSLDIMQDKTLQYLAAASKAKFKAGYYHDQNIPIFDFLLKAEKADMTEYIKQLIHYLSVFNT